MELLVAYQERFPSYLVLSAVSGAVFGLVFGATLGSAEGIVTATFRRILRGVFWGSLAGLIGGCVGFLLAQGILFFTGEYLLRNVQTIRLLALPLARAAGWSVLGLFIGISSGLQSLSIRKAAVGALGGLLGGFAGGALMEYGFMLFPGRFVVRAAALVLFGSLLGLSWALVESWLSFGCLRVLNGALKGREYLINQRSMSFGTSPACDIPIVGYRLVEKRHGRVVLRGRDLVLEVLSGHLKVNDTRVATASTSLKYDDVIACGSLRMLLRRE